MGDWRWLVMIGVIAVVIGVSVAWRKRPSRTTEDINVRMAELAAEAVKRAEAEFAVKLDYGTESVSEIEGILGKLHAQYSAGQLSAERLDREAMTWGAYIGEVMRRQKNGHWEQDHDVAGPRSYPIHYDGHQSFPCGWCFKRIRNGEEDNVWNKFQILTLRAGNAGTVFDGTKDNP